MIHARIDTAEHRKIVGFETGNRAQFDTRHGGDPLWVFLDSYRVKYRAEFAHFLTFPTNYQINEFGDIYLSNEPPIINDEVIPNAPPGYYLLRGRDGQYLKGADGYFIYGLDSGYTPPPEGMLYLMDPDGYFLKDPDESFLMEDEGDTSGPITYITDNDGSNLTDLDDSLITE